MKLASTSYLSRDQSFWIWWAIATANVHLASVRCYTAALYTVNSTIQFYQWTADAVLVANWDFFTIICPLIVQYYMPYLIWKEAIVPHTDTISSPQPLTNLPAFSLKVYNHLYQYVYSYHSACLKYGEASRVLQHPVCMWSTCSMWERVREQYGKCFRELAIHHPVSSSLMSSMHSVLNAQKWLRCVSVHILTCTHTCTHTYTCTCGRRVMQVLVLWTSFWLKWMVWNQENKCL